MPNPHRRRTRSTTAGKEVESRLRIVGGDLRHRTIEYNGDPGLRPMKDRVREALFNILGPRVRGKLVIDLFAGTGAVSFESLSRGAARALLIERRFPNVKVIQQSAATLGISDRVVATGGDAFTWVRSHTLEPVPAWLVFVCPPYEMHVTRRSDMLKMIGTLWQNSPPGSLFVVEADSRFAPQDLPDAEVWQVREYPPTVLAIAEKS